MAGRIIGNSSFSLALLAGECMDMKMNTVNYKAFGAKGDGKTDDLDAIIAAHKYAKDNNLPVVIDGSDSYYIGGADKYAEIWTDTDFGDATFIIDDIKLENHSSPVFVVLSAQSRMPLQGIGKLKIGQKNIGVQLPCECMVMVQDENVRQYIRYGLNQNDGAPKQDLLIVDADGNVDPGTPIIWDFDDVTSAWALPLDAKQLTIRGGHFITIANQCESTYDYHNRNIQIKRSNVLVEHLDHIIQGELDHGAPYSGFLAIRDCAFVTVKDSVFCGHKYYNTIGAIGEPVPMGTYDLTANSALNCNYIRCTQHDDIINASHWGIMGSNYTKNMVYDDCKLSRFDAHQGVANATVRNSTIGLNSINAIGTGTFLLENSSIIAYVMTWFRSDYGSFWRGDFIVRDCTYKPLPEIGMLCIFHAINKGMHDFGYPCMLPETITLQNLLIDDSAPEFADVQPYIFNDINPQNTSADFQEKYPYEVPKKIILENVRTVSGKKLKISPNPYPFRNTVIEYKD